MEPTLEDGKTPPAKNLTDVAGAPGKGASTRGYTRIALILASVILVVDQLTKAAILYIVDLPGRGSIDVLPFFNLTMVWNRGVSFGLFPAQSDTQKYMLVAFAIAIVGYLLWWLARARALPTALAIGAVIGGAIGNAIDRLLHGAVVDFFDFSALFFPYVFNVADAAITLGVIALVLEAVFDKEPDEDGRSPEEGASGATGREKASPDGGE